MFKYDAGHLQGSKPPFGVIKGVLEDQPGQYQIRFRDTQQGPMTDWGAVVIGDQQRADVTVPITAALGPGVRVLDLVAEWKGSGGLVSATARLVNVECEPDLGQPVQASKSK